MAAPLDLKREQRELYSAPRDRFVLVDVPETTFLQVDGLSFSDPRRAAPVRMRTLLRQPAARR